MKRLVAMICVLFILMVFAGNVFALDVVDNEYDILESAAHEEIERLYSLRGQLCFNYEEYTDIINKIDGSYVPRVETEVKTGVQQSDNYDSALGYAVTNFFYKIHLDQDPFIVYMIIQSFTVTGLEEVTEFRTPRSKCALV